MKGVEVFTAAYALLGHYLIASADVFVINVSAKLAAEQMHSEHATAQHIRRTIEKNNLEIKDAYVHTVKA